MAVELIAEVSSNHGGDLGLAKEFIWRFAEAGADWIKFQTTRVQHLRPDDPQYAWFQRAELSDDAHHELKAECEKAGVQFLTTVYHRDEVPLVRALSDVVKVGSGEAHELALARAIEDAGFRRVIVGCGVTPAPAAALDATRLTCRVDYLRAVTRYPCPAGLAHYDYVPYRSLHQYCGWSDHAAGLEGCQIAIAEGARVIEKHVCLPHQARPVKPWEATVEEFKALRAFADEDPTRFLGRWQAA